MGDLGKLIVAKGFKKVPKVQKIARSGHTDCRIIVPIPEGKRFIYSDLSYHLILIKFEEQRVFEIHLRKSLQLSSAVLIRYIGFKLHDREGSKGEKCKNNSKMKLPKASSTILILFKNTITNSVNIRQ